MVAYLGYTLRMRTLFRGWPIMVNDTHTRRRRLVPSSSIVVERKDDTYWIKRCTCPNHLNLPFLITKLTGSSPNSSLNSAFFFLSFKVTISSCSTQLYLTLLHVPLGMLIFQKFFFLNREFEFPGTRTRSSLNVYLSSADTNSKKKLQSVLRGAGYCI